MVVPVAVAWVGPVVAMVVGVHAKGQRPVVVLALMATVVVTVTAAVVVAVGMAIVVAALAVGMATVVVVVVVVVALVVNVVQWGLADLVGPVARADLADLAVQTVARVDLVPPAHVAIAALDGHLIVAGKLRRG